MREGNVTAHLHMNNARQQLNERRNLNTQGDRTQMMNR